MDAIYTYLKETINQIKEFDKTNDKEIVSLKQKGIYNFVSTILYYNDISRKEGLLSLEYSVQNLENSGSVGYLKELIISVVDGVEPEFIEQTGLFQFISDDVSAYEALERLVALVGVLYIQQGSYNLKVEKILLSMLPERMRDECRHTIEEYNREKACESEQKQDEIISSVCHGDINAVPEDKAYYIIKLADYTVKTLKEMDIRRLLMEIDNSDLCLIMIALSGDARRILLKSMSKRLAAMIVDDMNCMQEVRMSIVCEAVNRFYRVLIKLVQSSEIICEGSDVMELMGRIFTVQTEKQSEDIPEAEGELQKLFYEYRKGNDRYISISGGIQHE